MKGFQAVTLTVVALAALPSLASAKKNQSKDSCTALVLSGGGSNGAWEAGVLWGLVNYGNPQDYEYDVVAGVSIGSINASGLAMHEIGNETEAADFMYKAWEEIRSKDIYRKWPLSFVEGLYLESMYDSSPAYETLKRLLSPFHTYGRAFSLSTVDVETGQVVLLTDENTPVHELYKAVVASASVPGFFLPTKIGGKLLVDGMTAWDTNVQAAIDRCREMVDDDEKITIDVLICHLPMSMPQWDSSGNSWQNYWRAVDMRARTHSSDATVGVMRAHPRINWRHNIYQSKGSHGTELLDFSEETLFPLLEQGKQDAIKTIGLSQEEVPETIRDSDLDDFSADTMSTQVEQSLISLLTGIGEFLLK